MTQLIPLAIAMLLAGPIEKPKAAQEAPAGEVPAKTSKKCRKRATAASSTCRKNGPDSAACKDAVREVDTCE